MFHLNTISYAINGINEGRQEFTRHQESSVSGRGEELVHQPVENPISTSTMDIGIATVPDAHQVVVAAALAQVQMTTSITKRTRRSNNSKPTLKIILATVFS